MAQIELLQHAIERFGVVTVMDVGLYDITTNKPLMYLDTLKMSNITSEGQQKEIKGGKFADPLIIYNYGRTVNVEFQDALLSASTMKTLWGADVLRNAAQITENRTQTFSVGTGVQSKTLDKKAVAIQGVFDVTANAELTLDVDNTPVLGTYYWVDSPTNGKTIYFNSSATETHEIIVYYTALTGAKDTLTIAAGAATLNQTATKIISVYNVTDAVYMTLGTITPALGTYYWTTGTAMTFNTGNNADVVIVEYEVDVLGFAPVQALIKSSSFPKTVKFVGKTFLIEQASGRQILAEIEIPKLKLNSNFTLTMEAEGDASVFDFAGMALTNDEHELIKIKALRYLD